VSISTASSELRDAGDEGTAIFKVSQEEEELGSLHVVSTGIKVVVGGGEGIQDMIELSSELALLLIKRLISEHCCDGCWIVKASDLFN
jgi:hypothetical protein